MASMGWAGACPVRVRDQGGALSHSWDFQEGRTFQPRCGLRAAHPTEAIIMRYYTGNHPFYCGIDLHSRTMHVCILDHEGNTVVDQGIACNPKAFLKLIVPYRQGLVVGVESIFCWYWLADLCQEEKIAFVLGHAFYMKLIHGGKGKNDRLDAGKIARLLRCGSFPLAYAYPKGMRGNARPAAAPPVPGTPAERLADAHPHRQQPVQPARHRQAVALGQQPGRCRRAFRVG